MPRLSAESPDGAPAWVPTWALVAAGALAGAALALAGRRAGASVAVPQALVPPRAQASGRNARSPQQIPWPGWKAILWRAVTAAAHDRLLAVAAGVVFYALLATIPALTALVSSYALFADPKTIGNHLSLAAGLMPHDAFELVRDQMLRIAGHGDGRLTFGFLSGLAVAFWSANAGMKAIFDALNVIHETEERRGFLRLNAVSLAFTLGAVAMALLAIGAVVVYPVVTAYAGLPALDATAVALLRWPVLFALIVLGLAALYRYGPSHAAAWRWVSAGSLLAAAAWIAGSLAFSYYLKNFADYNATYGSLGAVVGLMIWMWMAAIVILAGAELNVASERQAGRGSAEKPRRA